MKFNRLGLLSVLLMAPCMAWGQQQLPAVTVQGQADYTGIWRPDRDANALLERDMRKKMRKKMKEAMGGKTRPPAIPADSAGRPSGNDRPGGAPRDGKHGGGAAPGDGSMAEPSVFGSIRPEMDFAAPLQGDLEIVSTAEVLRIGKSGTPLTELDFNRGATEIADGHSRAFVAWEAKQLVVEINTDDGVRVTYTYSLESQGERMRVRTNVVGGPVRIPGGIDMERLYVRQPL